MNQINSDIFLFWLCFSVPEIALPTLARTWLEQQTLYNKEARFPRAASTSVDKKRLLKSFNILVHAPVLVN